MADVDVLPYDYEEYGKEIGAYIDAANKKADTRFPGHAPNFAAAAAAARRFERAGAKTLSRQLKPPADSGRLNQVLLDTERALLIPEGLSNRPWFHHAIYAPGQYTGYAAVVIPGVNEAIDSKDQERLQRAIADLTAALNRAAQKLESYH